MLRKSSTDDRVLNEGFYVLVRDDGHYIEPIHEAKNDLESSKRTLVHRLSPVKLFDNSRKEEHRERETIEISQHSRLFNKETNEHLEADEFDIVESDDVECGYERKITFVVDPGDYSRGRRTVAYYETDLEALFRDGTLVTREQQADELESMLEEARHAQ